MVNGIFDPIRPTPLLNPKFDRLSSLPRYSPARKLINEVFESYVDKDGNFIEQFQTSGFDQRVFELCLFAYLKFSEYEIIQKYPSPDFLVARNNMRVAIEAVTANPSQGELFGEGLVSKSLSNEDYLVQMQNILAIKYGSPLISKLRKKYWELEHCKAIPLVIALQDFHHENSLMNTGSQLATYLYGERHLPKFDDAGNLSIEYRRIEEHAFNKKVIPSAFFAQPDTQHISAVMFSNSWTIPKFNRMALQKGYLVEGIKFKRAGVRYDPNPNSATPIYFEYDILDPPIVESWGQGVDVYHNPRAINPLPKDFFVDTARTYVENGITMSDIPGFHPLFSKTIVAEEELDS